MRELIYITTAAGGNATAIQILEEALDGKEYARKGKKLIDEFQNFQVEQAGFLIPKDKHFEMSGGEFCGNTAGAAAILLGNTFEKQEIDFTMSGFEGDITGCFNNIRTNKYSVKCVFPNLSLDIEQIDDNMYLADMGGIIYVVIKGKTPTGCETFHRRLIRRLNLEDRKAVGAVWVQNDGDAVKIDPVVWVKEIDSLFYETSCGSGSIAVAKVMNKANIIQPTGKVIKIFFEGQDVVVNSEIQILHKKHIERLED